MIRSVAIPAVRISLGAFLLGVACLLCGCGARNAGKVSGKVTLAGGVPLTTGTVNFLDRDKGTAADAKIDSSGNYTFATPLPAGTYKVFVLPNPPQQLAPGTPQPKPEPFKILPKYQDPSQTPISKEVKAGDNNIPIEIGN